MRKIFNSPLFWVPTCVVGYAVICVGMYLFMEACDGIALAMQAGH